MLRLSLPVTILSLALASALALAVAAAPVADRGEPAPDARVSALLVAVDSLIAAGKPGVAFERVAPALAAREAAGDRESPGYLRLLHASIEAKGRSNERPDSLSTARASSAVALAERLYGPTSLEAATARLDLARYVGRTQRRPAPALVLADSAVTLRRNRLGPDDLEVAAALVLAGTFARQVGRLDVAEAATSEVVRIRTLRLPPDHRDIAVALNNRAIVRRNRGDYAGSYADAKAAAAILTTTLPPEHGSHRNSLQTLAASAALADDPQAAIRAYETLLRILEAQPRPDSTEVALYSAECGLVYSELRDDATALRLQRKAQRILEAMAAPDSLALRNTLTNRGECLRRLGRLDEAQAAFTHALAIAESGRFPSTEAQESLHENLGLIERAQDRPDSARAQFDLAIDLLTRRGAQGARPQLRFHRGLARLAAGDTAGARADLEWSRTATDATYGAQGPLAASVRNFLAQLDAAEGDTAGAFPRAIESMDIERQRTLSRLRYLSERQALGYVHAPSLPTDLVLSLATRMTPGDPRIESAWHAVQQSRSLLIDEFVARAQARRLFDDPAIGALAREHHAARQRIANLLYSPNDAAPDSMTQAQVAAATRDAERLEIELARSGSPYRNLFLRTEPEFAALREALPDSTALVGLVRWNDASLFGAEVGRRATAERYAAFVTTGPGAPVALVDLGPAAPIEDGLVRWRRALLDPKVSVARERTLGEDVRRRVWDPIGRTLGATREVFLVTDAALHDLAWYALPLADGARLLDRDLGITLLSAERDLLRAPATTAPASTVLAVGGVDFDRRTPAGTATGPVAAATDGFRGGGDCVALARLRFAALPASATEAEELAARARTAATPRDCALLEGAGAHEAAFRAAAPGADWIHAATHGFYIAPSCRTADGSPADRSDRTLVALNPLLFSGIALAGANVRSTASGAEDDGILSADELAALDLSRVRTVVITGCNTGLGDYVAGEGTYGLRRSLERAGVRSVVLGLWPVDDRIAGRWSRAFYTACWEEGASVSAATRLAASRVRAEMKAARLPDRPAAWGPFVAAGRE